MIGHGRDVAALLMVGVALSHQHDARSGPQWTFDGAVCPSAYTPAFVIQGSGDRTPLRPELEIVTRGVVVGDFEAEGELGGFYLQDPVGDGDVATSDAVFVASGEESVSLGDEVAVRGYAGEEDGQTRVEPASIELCGVGSVEPTPLTLPLPDPDFLERFEGMLVTLPQQLYVTEHYQLGRFGQLTLSSGGRLIQPTQLVDPEWAAVVQAGNDLNRILLDDRSRRQNPDPIPFGRGGQPLSADNTVRGGDSVAGIVAVLTQTDGGNRASPTAYRLRVPALGAPLPSFQPSNPRPSTPPDVGGSLRVAGFNLLNYFNTFEGCTFGAGGESADCRGAGNPDEFERQAAKAVAALVAIDADILGIVEIENDGYGPGSALADLVGRLNRATGSGTYDWIDADRAMAQVNSLGTDAIKVALIYRPASVRPVGRTAALNTTEFVEAGEGAPRNRPTLAQAFETSDGERLIVAVNHLKSKGSACNGDSGQSIQGNCNQVRTRAASLLVDWLASDPTGTGESDVLIVGDLNSYAREDPIRVFREAGFQDLLAEYGQGEAYSYAFDGQWGYLDYLLASPTLADQVSGAGEWHINADEPGVLDYNTDFKSPGQVRGLFRADPYRTSDHDPVLVGIDLARSRRQRAN